MANVNLTHLSKVMAHALRHRPWLYELELDDEGWTPVDDLLTALRQHLDRWSDLTSDHLQAAIDAADKRRYEIRGDRIRALYGHSTASKIKKTPARPPAVLYHGTSHNVVDEILKSGLRPMRRQYVHLSVDTETAAEVGRRKQGTLVILVIDAEKAYQSGIPFYEGNEKVWLADGVPPEFIAVKNAE